ncbi:BTAD domain-containing putative transcriptional regulator [Amycolatopsis sp. NPDC051371]|uniref:AfsR/SARP family transcriptional regulator n=1 Tax=Amycolatopsis sp. NPDC051371 TaxID=3155800 RepID=UPI0034424A9F
MAAIASAAPTNGTKTRSEFMVPPSPGETVSTKPGAPERRATAQEHLADAIVRNFSINLELTGSNCYPGREHADGGGPVAVEFRLLGSVEVHRNGQMVNLGHTRQLSVLAALLVEPNRPVGADQLVDRVWGEHPPRRGRQVLYGYLSRLRATLAEVPELAIVRRSTGYVLSVDEDLIDLYRFRRLVAAAGAAEDDAGALRLFEEALVLWRGPAIPDLDSPWFTAVKAELEAELRAAELDRTDVALRRGQHAEVLADLTTQAARHPLDERLAGQLMLALYRSGRQADALQHYQRLRAVLADQLGTDPNPSLQQLYQRILTADPGLDRPASALTTAHVTPRQLPPPPAWFAGRISELTALDAALEGGAAEANTVVISALAGGGGIGKTWLALHWAHTHVDRFPDGQLFVDLRGFSPGSDPMNPLTAVRGFLDALGIDPTTVSGGLDEHTARFRSCIAGKRMLVLLDNAADADQLIPLLPGTPSCVVIMTSRTVLTPLLTRHSARHLNLDVLTETEAHAAFAQRLGNARVAVEPNAVAELVELCGRYPLALAVMASRALAHPHLPLADFATELRQAGLDALDDADPATSVSAVLSWSLRELTRRQYMMFVLLSTAPGSEIGLPAAASLADLSVPEARVVLRRLVDSSLVDRRARDRYAMHDLIRDYAGTLAQQLPDEVRESALLRVLNFYTHTAHAADRLLHPYRDEIALEPPVPGVRLQPLPDTAAALEWFDIEYPALQAAEHIAGGHGWQRLVWHLAWAQDTFRYRRGHRHDQLRAWQAALDAVANLPDPAKRVLVHQNLGDAYAALGHLQDGIGHLHQALALAEQQDDARKQADTHRMLARAWEEREDDRRALEHATEALELYRALSQPAWEAEALNLVGWYTARLGEYDRARDHCRAALTLHLQHDDTEGAAATLDSLGYIEHHSGHGRRAVDHYQRSLGLYRDLGHTYGAASTLDSLGHPLVRVGEHDGARAVWREALELFRQQGRDEDAGRVWRQLDALESEPQERAGDEFSVSVDP